MKPTRFGEVGETEFIEGIVWVCFGGTEWVDHIKLVEPPKEMWPYLTTEFEPPKTEKFSSRLGRAWRVLRRHAA